jgi:hypothetical protein
MSLVDDIFSSIPAPLIDQFGINATYLKSSGQAVYTPETGTVSNPVVEISIKIVISELKPEEREGLYQSTDVKILIAASSLAGYFPQTTDSIRYVQAGRVRTVKIIGMFSYRGDSAIMHSVVGRLS